MMPLNEDVMRIGLACIICPLLLAKLDQAEVDHEHRLDLDAVLMGLHI
jgi:hypothetical protein